MQKAVLTLFIICLSACTPKSKTANTESTDANKPTTTTESTDTTKPTATTESAETTKHTATAESADTAPTGATTTAKSTTTTESTATTQHTAATKPKTTTKPTTSTPGPKDKQVKIRETFSETAYQPEQEFSFKTPKGGTERLRVKDMTFETVINNHLPYDETQKQFFLCRDILETEDQKIKKTEVGIELDNLITYLKSASKPRELTDAQKLFLGQVPKCRPFVVEFNIISRLLNNYDLATAD